MPSPTSAPATLRPDLGGSMEEFDLAMDRAGFIGQRVLPVFEAAEAAGAFGIIPIEQLLQSPDTTRSPGSGYARGKFKFTPASYVTQEYGWEEPVDDNESKMYRNYFDAEQVATQRAYGMVLGHQERRAAALIFNTGTWTGASLTTAVSVPWSTHATATPITDVEAAVLKVYNGSGLWPTAMILNRLNFRHLRQCTQVKEMIMASGAGSGIKPKDITAAMLAQVFDLQEIIVAGGTKNTAIEGQDAALSQIWSNSYAMIGRICGSNDIREPGLGRTLHWSVDGSQVGGAIESYEDQTRSTVIRVRHQVQEKVFHVSSGHLLSGISS